MKKVIVIGGGILGAATAYELAKSGAVVTLVEAEYPGQATDAGAGIVCPWVSKRRNQHWYALARGGARIYPELIRQLEEDGISDTGYVRTGSLNLHDDPDKLEEMYALILKRRETAPEIGEVELLNQEEARRRFPLIKGGFGAVFVSGGAHVNGRKLRDALLQAAQQYGMERVKGEAILTAEGQHITGVRAGGRFIEADAVVAANGAWMRQLFEPLLAKKGQYFDVRPQRAQILHLALKGHEVQNWPVVKSPYNQYMLMDSDRLIVGATQENNTGFDCRITAGGVYDMLDRMLEIAPSLSEATLLETRVGFRPMTPESVPVMGLFPGFSGLAAANGLGSSGLTMAPFIADQLAKLVLGEQLDVDLSGYELSKIIKIRKD